MIRMFKNGKGLHKALEKLIPSFYDADLWNDPEEYVLFFDEKQIRRNWADGQYVSLDNEEGQEAYYYDEVE